MAAVCAETIDSSRHTGVAIRSRELCVADEVVFVQGLLDEEQGELVELGEVSYVAASVGGVCVHLQHQIGSEAVPDRLDRNQVPARLNLELDPPVTGLEVLGDAVQQLADRAHDADGDPGGHCVGDTTEEGWRTRRPPRAAVRPAPPSPRRPSPCGGP